MAEKDWKKSEFVPVSLSKQDVERLKEWVKSRSSLSDDMHKIIENGYKLTFSWDDKNQAHVCWMIPTHPKSENAGLILSGRGRNPVNALAQALWLHFVKYKATWPGRNNSEPDSLWDDE